MFYIMINRLDQVKKDFNSISKKGLIGLIIILKYS